MKKIMSLLCICVLLCTSCVNDDDVDFDTVGSTFEITVDNFSTANNFGTNVTVPNNIIVEDSDVALVYLLDPIKSASANEDVWEPLPRTLFFNDGGHAQFVFNFIFNANTGVADLEIFLESDDLNTLATDITTNQSFRIVIVPSTFATDGNIDLSDINAVEMALGL